MHEAAVGVPGRRVEFIVVTVREGVNDPSEGSLVSPLLRRDFQDTYTAVLQEVHAVNGELFTRKHRLSWNGLLASVSCSCFAMQSVLQGAVFLEAQLAAHVGNIPFSDF